MAALKNWKTSLGGIIWIVLYAAQTAGIDIPGVHMDPSGLALALSFLFAQDASKKS